MPLFTPPVIGVSVSNAAALSALSTLGMITGNLVYVQTFGAVWSYQPASVLTPDSSTILAAAGGGNWLRGLSLITEAAIVQATWFIDPAAGNNENSGLTSGVPLKSFSELVRRMGTSSPILSVTTTLTFLSSHTDNTDPVVWTPTVTNGAVVSIQGTAPTSVAAIFTLNAAKNRTAGANAMLSGSFSAGSPTTGMMVENTTAGKSSRAIIHTTAGGSNWNLTQPLVKTTVPETSLSPAEVDTWASTDTVNLLTLVKVNIALFAPQIVDFNGGGTNYGYLYQLQVFDPAGSGKDLFIARNHVLIQECVFERGFSYSSFNLLGPSAPPQSPSFINNYYLGGLFGISSSGGFFVIGGGTNNFTNVSCSGGQVVNLDGDYIAGGFGLSMNGAVNLGFVFLDANSNINAPALVSFKTILYGGHVLYGTAAKTLSLHTTSAVQMAGTFTAGWTLATLISTGVILNGASLGNSVAYSANVATIHNGIATTVANLDAATGAAGFGGTAFNLGGASVSTQS